MTHPRTAVRRYANLIIKEEVDVGGRVYSNRPSPIIKYETPCVLTFFSDEPTIVIGGTELVPRVHQRNLILNTDIVTREVIRPTDAIHQNEDTEDLLDKLAWDLELAFFADLFFGRRLSGYDPNKTPEMGLLLGMRLIGTTPYTEDSDGDTRIVGQRLQWELPFDTEVQGSKKYDDFNEYYMAIIRIDSDETTVDRELIEAQGEI